MKTTIRLIIMVLCVNFSYAQNKAGSKWIIGGSFALEATFTDTARPVVKVKYDTSKIAYPYYYTAGHSDICDSATGKLLFSTTGMLIHDTTGAIMDNGDNLVESKYYSHNFYPNAPYTQASLILPKGHSGQYYVFIATLSDSAYDYFITNVGGGGMSPLIDFNTMLLT